jgi:AcrR family transcriptional regulator
MVNVASVEKVARRKEDILQAAITIFSEKGYYSASIADIANLLKIGHGTIYRYYKNKQAIFDAVVTSILQKLATVVQDEPPETSSLQEYKEQIIRISDRLIGIFQDDQRIARIALYETPEGSNNTASHVSASFLLFSKFIQEYMRNGVDKGFLRPNMDQEIAARIVTSMIFETIKAASIEGSEEVLVSRWRDEIIQIMIGGLGI